MDKLIRELEKRQEKDAEKRMKKRREKEKTMAGWYAMTQDEERQELEKERGGEMHMRVAMLSSIAERVKEVSEGLLKDQAIDDITKLVKSLPTADEFFSELTRRREGVGMPRWETPELLRRSELRGWIDEIQSILRETGDEEEEEKKREGEEEHDAESDEECEKWMNEYEKKMRMTMEKRA